MYKNGLVRIKLFIAVILLVSQVAFVPNTSGKGLANRFVIVVNSGLYPYIQTQIDTYVSDLTKEGYTPFIKQWVLAGSTASGLRNYLKNEWTGAGLVGALFVGKLPVVTVSTGEDSGPSDVYFMDLDGTFYPPSGSAIVEHTGSTDADITVGRLWGSVSYGGRTEVGVIQNYFNKNHAYRTGNLSLPIRAYNYANSSDWTWTLNNNEYLMHLIYNDVTTDIGPFRPARYESMYIMGHSGVFSGSEIFNYNLKTHFTFVNGCASFNFLHGDSEGEALIFGDTHGLGSFGSTTTTWAGAIDSSWYNGLRETASLGSGIKSFWTRRGYFSGYMYGHLLLGDPTLYIHNHLRPNAPILNGSIVGGVGNSYDLSLTTTTFVGQSSYFVDWGDGSTTTTALAPSGTTVPVSHTWSAPGVYTIKAKAIGSSTSGSAWTYLTVTVGRDLVISDLWVPMQTEQGKTLTVLDAVSNLGGQSTSPSTIKVNYALSGGSLPSPLLLSSRDISDLVAGATDFSRIDLSVPSTLADGAYALTVTVDSLNAISEAREGNNTITRSIKITKPYKYDFDGNDKVGIEDILAVVSKYGWVPGDLYYDPAYDFDKSNKVGIEDILAVVNHYSTDPRLPKGDLKVSGTAVSTGNPVTITYSGKETEVNIVKFELDYTTTAGYEITSSTPGGVTHTYNTAGANTVTLRVTDDKGQTDSTLITINVINFSTAAPALSAVSDGTYQSVTLNWTGGSSPYWRVYRGGVLLTTVTNARTYTDNTVVAGINYSYYVQASKDSGGSVVGTNSNPVPVTPGAITPTLSVSAAAGFSISLSWGPTPPGQVAIERGYTNMSFGEIAKSYTGVTSYADDTVVPGKTYYYRIRFTDSSNTKYSKYSNIIDRMTMAVTTTTSAAVTSGQTNSITVTWNTTGTNGISVLIERDSGGGFIQTASIAGHSTSYIDLVQGGSHSYRIRYSDGKGGYSLFSNATASVSPTASTTTPMVASSGIGLTSATGISWIPFNPLNYPNALVEMKSPGQSTFSEIANTTQVALIKAQLTAGTSYTFRMRFANAAKNGVSNYSSETNFTTPAPVLSATGSSRSVTLTISGTTSAYYMVYRSIDGVNFTYIGYTAATSLTDNGLAGGTTYYYYVKGWSGGQPSNVVTSTAQ